MRYIFFVFIIMGMLTLTVDFATAQGGQMETQAGQEATVPGLEEAREAAEQAAAEAKIEADKKAAAAAAKVACGAGTGLIDPNCTLQENLQKIYPVAVNIILLLAFLAVIYAGYLYITSFGQQDRITEAKNWLIAAVTGTVLIILVPVIIREIESLGDRLPGTSSSEGAPATNTQSTSPGGTGSGTGSVIQGSESDGSAIPDIDQGIEVCGITGEC